MDRDAREVMSAIGTAHIRQLYGPNLRFLIHMTFIVNGLKPVVTILPGATPLFILRAANRKILGSFGKWNRIKVRYLSAGDAKHCVSTIYKSCVKKCEIFAHFVTKIAIFAAP
jgi:hypothetical protein